MLLGLAWFRWIRTTRAELPPWRNGLSLSALSVLTSLFVAIAIDTVAGLLSRPPHTDFNEMMLLFSHQFAILGVGLAVALKGITRTLCVIAGVLMLLFWPFGYT